jgi:putative transposase
VLVQRTEKHIIDRQSKWYNLLFKKCHIAKNIYNHGNYLVRKEFLENGKWLRYGEVDKLVKSNLEYPDYWELELSSGSQQILRRLEDNWKSFFVTIKDWKNNPSKYKGRPQLPKYLKKDGVTEFSLTKSNCRLKQDGLIHFSKSLCGFTLQPQFIKDSRLVNFNQCRFVPHNQRIIVELIYTIDISEQINECGAIGSIDLGLDNFVTFVDNMFNKPIIINGKGLKSCNNYFNYRINSVKAELDRNGNDIGYSHLLYGLQNKRADKIDCFLHRVSKYIVNHCLSLGITSIVVGHNKYQKQGVRLKNFAQIPYYSFIQKLKYKCQEEGINFILSEESYTSGTSFLDNEPPLKEYYNPKRRVNRGLFRSNDGTLINADVNGAYQIMRKVFQDVEKPLDIGCVLNPVRVNLII